MNAQLQGWYSWLMESCPQTIEVGSWSYTFDALRLGAGLQAAIPFVFLLALASWRLETHGKL